MFFLKNDKKRSPKKTLYVVATSHLDTQWRWTFQETISRYLPRTLSDNFALFKRYQKYKFSFEGAWRYMLAKEYYPELYAELGEWIKKGRWCVCGSSIDAGDVNVASPEALVRQILYANKFFRDEFGVESRDIFLPDCFGFSWALPSVAHHCGLRGFSTSKLEWGSSYGIPFNVGFWRGVDGNGIAAAVNPGQYSFPIKEKIYDEKDWLARIDETGERSGAYVDMKYFGLGDTGGAPDEASVQLLEKSIKTKSAYKIVSAGADQLFRDLNDEQLQNLPVHDDEFLLIEHGVGSYTAMAAMKRWNRQNEQLADAAERASVIADWMDTSKYPREKLREAWTRFLANQMHDILPGTCIPEAYEFSWNDEILSLNQFDSVLTNAVTSCSASVSSEGNEPLLFVYNPLSIDRSDVAGACVQFEEGVPESVSIIDSAGVELPVQITRRENSEIEFLFQAKVPSLSLSVFRIQKAGKENAKSKLRVSSKRLENEYYVVLLDDNGDVESIFDKKLKRELLRSPHQLVMLDHGPKEWPAWTIIYNDISKEPREIVHEDVEVRVVESGPVRVAVEVTRTAAGSVFRQKISLTAGQRRVDIDNDVEWATEGTLLKAAFPFNATNPKATYDIGWGVIERGNNHERQHEVPAQQWAAIDDQSGDYGIAVMNDSKYGWDKPDDNTLRLTLLHTPRMTGFHCFLGGANFDDKFEEQAQLDFGRHSFRYSTTSYEGSWRNTVCWDAMRLNQPFRVFSANGAGENLKEPFSFLKCNSPQIAVKALKKAEESDEYILRVQELTGEEVEQTRIDFAAEVLHAREVNGSEQHIVDHECKDGILAFSMHPFQVRTFAFKLKGSNSKKLSVSSKPVPLPYNIDVISMNDNRFDGSMDAHGHSLPGELLPEVVTSDDVEFLIGPKDFRALNAVACHGQEIKLPTGKFSRLDILAASAEDDVEAEFLIDGTPHRQHIQKFDGFVGQWDNRHRSGFYETDPSLYHPAFIKRDPVAWVGTHLHCARSGGDVPYTYGYLFHYRLLLTGRSRNLRLPVDNRVRILSASMVSDRRLSAQPAWPLYDFYPRGAD